MDADRTLYFSGPLAHAKCLKFLKTLQALEALSTQIIRPYQILYEIPHEIQSNIKYRPFFKMM
ncbi:hypothetical protein OROMI_030331 [Orobanche minor]